MLPPGLAQKEREKGGNVSDVKNMLHPGGLTPGVLSNPPGVLSYPPGVLSYAPGVEDKDDFY